MLYPSITKLYMYKPPNDYTLNILRNNRLWAAKPEQFNDPFDDGDLKIAKDITAESVLEAAQRWRSERVIAQYKASNLDTDGNFTSEEQERVKKVIQEELIKKIKTLESYAFQRYVTLYLCGPIMHKNTWVFALNLSVPKITILAMKKNVRR